MKPHVCGICPGLRLLRFGKWDEVLAVSEPADTNDFLVDRALWHFARGLAFAARQDVDAAAREEKSLTAIATSEAAKKLSSPNFPVADTLTVSAYWLAGKVAGVKGDTRTMIELLEKAAAAEDAMPYMEPSYWPILVRPTLGGGIAAIRRCAQGRAGFPRRLAALGTQRLELAWARTIPSCPG